jgi:DNA-binding MarR family transcriptional regulator
MNLTRLLLERYRWFDDALRSRLEQEGMTGLTTAESMVFPYLDPEGIRQADLARHLGVTRQSTQTLVRGLERKGLIELVDDPADGRSKLVMLTDEGRRTIPVALSIFEELEAHLGHQIGPDDVAHLRAILTRDWGSSPKDSPSITSHGGST